MINSAPTSTPMSETPIKKGMIGAADAAGSSVNRPSFEVSGSDFGMPFCDWILFTYLYGASLVLWL